MVLTTLSKQTRSTEDPALHCHSVVFLIIHRSIVSSLVHLRRLFATSSRTYRVETRKRLVDEEGLNLRAGLAHLLVAAHETNLGDPGSEEGGDGESGGGGKSDNVAGSIGLGPQVGCPDERGVHDGCDYTNGNGLLLWSLATSRSTPTQDERVDTVCSDSEDDHGDIAACNTEGRACDKETDGSDDLRDGNVPCALIEFAG
jgi:hypothetical protein